MLQILKKSKGKSLFLKFEDIRLSGFETSDFARLNSEIERRDVKILFFDEIQIIDKWEIFISQKLKSNVDSFNDYLQIGGMPEYIKNNRGIILQHQR